MTNPQSQLDPPDSTAADAPGALRTRRPPILHYFTRQKKFLASQPASIAILLSLAVPAIAESFINALIGITDTVVAGHTGITDAQREAASGAIGTMTYLQWLAGLMVSAFGAGATAIVARSVGARRTRVANRVAGTACSGAFVVGVVTAILFFAFAGPIVRAIGLKDLAASYGQQYLQIMAVTIFIQSASQIGMACLRGAGDTVSPMLVTLAVSIVNLVTSPALTFGWFGLPAMGVRGNALGTMLAFLVSGCITLYMLLTSKGSLRLEPRHFRIVPHVLVRIVRIGLPSWFENMLLWSGQFVIVIFVVNETDKALGSGVTMAAHNATLRIESLAFMPGFAFGIAAGAMVGQYLGAKNLAEARHAALLARRMGVVTMTLAALPMVLFPSFLLGLMVQSDKVVAAGGWPLVLAGLAQPGFAFAICMGGALRGAGDTFWPMISTLVGMFVVRLPLVLGLSWYFRTHGHPELGLLAVWIGIFVDLLYRGIQNTVVFLRGKWMTIKV